MAKLLPIAALTEKIAAAVSKDDALMAFFAKHWLGTLDETLAAVRIEGVEVKRAQGQRFMRHPGFVRMLRQTRGENADGVWTRVELQQWLTRVAAGLEVEGYETIMVPERVLPGEDDFDAELGTAPQWRNVECKVPKYPEMISRLRAADLLGKTLGAYLDRVEVSGDLKISVSDLLDDDLKHAKQVMDVSPDLAQVVDKGPIVSHNRSYSISDTADIEALM